jgi:diguanylate cyclase (GGDEF)-like protein
MSTGRILIVGADAYNSLRLQQAFEPEGYEVLVAENGQEGWDICRRKLPQAVVLDVYLPDVDGYELLRRIRSSLRTRHIHVTFLTMRQERRDRIIGLEMGADEIILKPYDAEEVHLRIRNALRRSKTGNLVNPATGLPGKGLIEEQLREVLRRRDDWAVLRVVVQHLDEFSDAYGFLAGEDVLRTTAQILSEALDELGETNDFIGHSGSDVFIVITSAKTGEELVPRFTQQLKTIRQTHFSSDDRERGFITIRQSDGSELDVPLLQIDVQMITAADGPFSDIMQLSSALG